MNNLNIQLRRGDLLLIVGPQECGKSTLARKIAAPLGDCHEILACALVENGYLPFDRTLIVEGGLNGSAFRYASVMIRRGCAYERTPMGRTIDRPTPAIIWCVNEDELPVDAMAFPIVRFGENGIELIGTWPQRMICGAETGRSADATAYKTRIDTELAKVAEVVHSFRKAEELRARKAAETRAAEIFIHYGRQIDEVIEKQNAELDALWARHRARFGDLVPDSVPGGKK